MIDNSMQLFHDEAIIHLLGLVPLASHMERRFERREIHIDQRRCVNCVLSVILPYLAHGWIDGLTRGPRQRGV